MSLIYKLSPRDEWQAAEAKGVFTGAPIDIADGFIHFSTADTVEETANKWFADMEDVLLIAVDADHLDGEQLKYEPSRGGELFPHLYGSMPMDAVVSVQDLPKSGDGFDFTGLLA
ncbi:MAG: DUF952 domain-containing protein [Pseudomonadota bacterium]